RAPVLAWSLARPLSEALSPAEQAEVTEGCYEMLLRLSDAVGPGEDLKVLDRAARLRPEPTPAWHLRRAACLTRLGDAAGRAREEELARRLKPNTALDHFLIGREHLDRGRLGAAVPSLEEAIRLDPNQLGAHLLLAAIDYTTMRYREAESSLHNC